MSMPERIWAGLWESVDRVRTGWQEHEPKKSNRFQEISFEDATEYIRADIHQREIERLERELAALKLERKLIRGILQDIGLALEAEINGSKNLAEKLAIKAHEAAKALRSAKND